MVAAVAYLTADTAAPQLSSHTPLEISGKNFVSA